jgi:Flp pilus assembly protein CpaB
VEIEQPALAGRARRALHTRVSSGHLVMLLAGALGVLLTLSLLRAADHTTAVFVAAHDLAPGTIVTEGDLRVSRVRVDASVLATLFTADDASSARGQVVRSIVPAGALMTRDLVRPTAARAAPRVMSVPLPRAHAVGGDIHRGDRVDVLAVDDDGAAGYVLTDAEVVSAESQSSGPLAGGSSDLTVSLVVDGEQATRLAAAFATGSVTLVRSTGAAPLDHPAEFAGAGAPS